MDFLERHVEALIFCSPNPIKIAEIQNCLSEMFDAEIADDAIQKAIQHLEERYSSEDFSFEIVKVAEGYQFLTKPAYQSSIGILLKQQSKKRLSRSALETLAIIAYKQPISKPALEQIRGVNCDYATKKLLEKELIEIKGKSDAAGRPVLYGTTVKFLEHFGINSLKEMPTLKDFSNEENIIAPNKEDLDFIKDALDDSK
ncbi:MAG: SMC-Scp complex subunit ScpB [Flammeovirgaceae bacterium]